MSAFLMSVFLNGMDDDETFLLTGAMIKSGDKLDLSFLDTLVSDKHLNIPQEALETEHL
jgi:pyrimidine-nucleoside phosphorylase